MVLKNRTELQVLGNVLHFGLAKNLYLFKFFLLNGSRCCLSDSVGSSMQQASSSASAEVLRSFIVFVEQRKLESLLLTPTIFSIVLLSLLITFEY